MKITSFTFQLFFISTSLLLITSCKGQNSSSDEVVVSTPSNSDEAEPTHTAPKTPVNSPESIAHFEAGLEAANTNNMPLAFKEFTQAAEKGHVYAQYNLGLMYEQGLGTSKNAKEAVYWYNKSAEQGNSAAQFNLGVCYENGLGTSVDFDKANTWYRKASVQGDGLAVGNLGMLYIRGDGVNENKVAGVALLLMSTTIDPSPQNQAKKNISATKGLTADMVAEAQALSAEMGEASNLLVPLDNYLDR